MYLLAAWVVPLLLANQLHVRGPKQVLLPAAHAVHPRLHIAVVLQGHPLPEAVRTVQLGIFVLRAPHGVAGAVHQPVEHLQLGFMRMVAEQLDLLQPLLHQETE
jgi:hypothetical protein